MNGNGAPILQREEPATEITFRDAHINIHSLSDGGRLLEIIPRGSETSYRVPLTSDVARALGKGLSSALPTAGADEMPGR